MRVPRAVWSGLWASLLVFGLADNAGAAGARYDGHRVVRVNVRSAAELQQALALTDDVWSEEVGLGPIDLRVAPQQYAALQASGLSFEVLIEDLQQLVDAQTSGAGGRGPFDDYMSYSQVLAYLDTLAALRPDLAETFVIGESLEQREIVGIRIGGTRGGDYQPAVLFHGAQHAREWITVPVVLYLADQLIRNYETDPKIRDLVDRIEWHLVPVLNVDGYIYTWTNERMWRKNRRNNGGGCWGVDLNRNWGVGWGGGGSSGNPCSETYRGTAAFSEPETSVIRDWILAHPNIVAYGDLHSYSQIIFYPYSYDDILPPEPDLSEYEYLAETQAEIARSIHGKVYTYGPGYHAVYQVSGASRDWVYGAADRFAFGYELRDTGQYGFVLPPEQIIPQCEEIVPALVFYSDYMSTPERVQAPNGGEAWAAGEAHEIRWFAHRGAVDSVDLLYSRDGGATYPYVIAAGLEHLGTYNWVVPNTPSETCRVRVVIHYADHGSQSDDSDADFTITRGPELIYEFPLDSNPAWATEGLWAFGQPTGGGGQYGGKDPSTGHTGVNVYGYNLNGDYENNLPERHLTTVALDCRNLTGTRLVFWRWLGVEQPQYDRASVRVSRDGSNWTKVWENAAEVADKSWQLQPVDISAVADGAATVYVRWTMGPTDGQWRYCGWNIDDVQILGVPTITVRPGDTNCDGHVDFGDVNPFVLALTDPDAYAQRFPDCPLGNRDVNGDGEFDFGDVNPFVALLSGDLR